jgi:hypothetical protein
MQSRLARSAAFDGTPIPSASRVMPSSRQQSDRRIERGCTSRHKSTLFLAAKFPGYENVGQALRFRFCDFVLMKAVPARTCTARDSFRLRIRFRNARSWYQIAAFQHAVCITLRAIAVKLLPPLHHVCLAAVFLDQLADAALLRTEGWVASVPTNRHLPVALRVSTQTH